MKRCNICRATRRRSEFYANRKAADGLQSCCKRCRRAYLSVNAERIARQNREYRTSHPVRRKRPAIERAARVRRSKLDLAVAKYGLTEELYLAMLEEQGGVCAICQTPPAQDRRLAVDHCHTTGRVRGLLCMACNLALGGLRDDPARVGAALAYLTAPGER